MRERSAYMGAEIYLHFAKPQINFKHMKLPILIAGCCLLSSFFLLSTHTETIDSFYDKYKPLEKVKSSTHVKWIEQLTGGMFEKEEISSLLEQPSKLKILVLGEEQVEKSELRSLKENMGREGLEHVIKVKNEDEKFDLFLKQTDDREWHLFYLVLDKGDLVFLSMKGDWPLLKIFSD